MKPRPLVSEDLRRRILDWGADVVGFGDIREGLAPELAHLPRAISIGLRHHAANAREYWKGSLRLISHRDGVIDYRLGRIQRATVGALRDAGRRFFVIPPDSEGAKGRFAARLYPKLTHKRAATCAGLGWIGKSGLLVTPEHGARLSWGTILTDADLDVAEPVLQSRCGTCAACVRACPVGAIRGVLWHRGIDLEELLDVQACLAHVQANRKLTGTGMCGRCSVVCPIGSTRPATVAHPRTVASEGLCP